MCAKHVPSHVCQARRCFGWRSLRARRLLGGVFEGVVLADWSTRSRTGGPQKKILLGICSRVAVFWEGTLDIDDRWSAADLCSLVPAGPRAPGVQPVISVYIKEAMTIKAYNVMGSGVRSPYHLVVGMAAGANCDGKEVKRAALSQKCGKEAPPRKRRNVSPLLSETSCRRLADHHMWQYFCTFRPYPIHF